MRRFIKYLGTREGRIASSAVIACGIALGYFICRTFVMPLTKTYPSSFVSAKWIQIAEGGQAGYFRKELYVPGVVESAWIEIASTGGYQLVVNNVQLDNMEFPGTRPSGIYDITALLAPGENVIAVYVAGDSSNGPRQIIARGAYTVAGAPPEHFITDGSWRGTQAASSIPGGALWSAPAYDDTSWPHTKVITQPRDIDMLQPLSVDPRLLTEWSHGDWITGPNGTRGEMIFASEFDSTRRPRNGWLELAANGPFTITINGRLAMTTPSTPEAELFGPNAPVMLTGTATRYSRMPVLVTPRSGALGSHIYSAFSQAYLNQFKPNNGRSSASSNVSVSVAPPTNTRYAAPNLSSNSAVNQIGATVSSGSGQTISTAASSTFSSSSATSSLQTSAGYGNSDDIGETVPGGASYSMTSLPTGGSSYHGSFQGGVGPAGSSIAAIAAPSAPSSAAGATGGAASSKRSSPGSQSSSKYAGSLGATTSLSPGQILSLPNNPDTTPTSPPSTGDISPEPASVAAQVFPLTGSPGDAPQTALALTAYDISPYLKAGLNIIVIRVHAGLGTPVLMADGVAELENGELRRIATDGRWSVRLPGAHGSVTHVPASVAGGFAASPWGPPVWIAANPLWIPGQDTHVVATWLVTILLVTVGTLVLWFAAGWLFAKAETGPEPVWSFDAFLHLPIFLATMALLLSAYDVRLAYDWCFIPAIAWSLIISLLLSKILLLAAPRTTGIRASAAASGRRFEWQFVVLFAITVVGFLLRLNGFDKTWMVHDETAMVVASWAIPKYGFPLVHAGSYTRYLATYELIPYPIALFTALLGRSMTAYRLPSLIFSTITIPLIGWIGRKMFDWRVGLLAALIWALLPVPINWAKDAFYPSQEGFFSALTFWCFWETIKGKGINAKFMRLTALFFVIQYFSWEASGFVLITLFAAILAIKWGEWDDWVLEPSLWRCFGVVSTIVITQLCYRTISGSADYLSVMKDLSDICTPAIVPLDRLVFNPLYYLDILFFAENHILITLMALIALPLAFRNKAILYLDVCLLVLYLNYTLFLDHYAPRYCYIWLSLLVLSGAASFIALCDLFKTIRLPRWGTALKAISMAMAMLIFVLGSNESMMKLFRLAPKPEIPVWYDRVGVPYKTNYHDCNMYVLNHMMPGDIVMSMNPHMFYYDTNGTIYPDYCPNTLLALRMVYDGGIKPIGYIDKWLGAPQIRNLSEMASITARAGRIWVICTSLHDESPPVSNFITRNGRLMMETVKEQVWLIHSVPSWPSPVGAGSARALRTSVPNNS